MAGWRLNFQCILSDCIACIVYNSEDQRSTYLKHEILFILSLHAQRRWEWSCRLIRQSVLLTSINIIVASTCELGTSCNISLKEIQPYKPFADWSGLAVILPYCLGWGTAQWFMPVNCSRGMLSHRALWSGGFVNVVNAEFTCRPEILWRSEVNSADPPHTNPSAESISHLASQVNIK